MNEAQRRRHAAHPNSEIDVARLKEDVRVSHVAGMIVDLRPSGQELRGRCPFHDDRTPSFQVNDAKGVWFCFGCRRGGDVIALVQEIGGSSFVESCEWLMQTQWASPPSLRRSAEPAAVEVRQANLHRAKSEWRMAKPLPGTPAEAYLATRGITGHVPGCIRYAEVPRHWLPDGTSGRREPAMIAAAQDVDGSVVGISRTFIDRFGRKSTRGNPRLSLGQMRGCALRLGPAAENIMLAVGVEDALSLTRMFPGASVWSAFGDANLPHVRFPDEVRRVLICGDADEPGRAAAAAAAIAYAAVGLSVEDLQPRAGKDFNEEWLLLHV